MVSYHLNKALLIVLRHVIGQFMTGLAVLLSGWVRLRVGLSVYHFMTISDLAWMASDTQLVAFFTLFKCVQSTYQGCRVRPDIQPYVSCRQLCRAFEML